MEDYLEEYVAISLCFVSQELKRLVNFWRSTEDQHFKDVSKTSVFKNQIMCI